FDPNVLDTPTPVALNLAAVTGPPTATTGAAGGVGNDTAQLAGTVDPDGEDTNYTFEYGTTLGFGSGSTITSINGTSPAGPVSAQLNGLAPNTTYFYRLVATNGSGTSTGAVESLTTSGPALAPVAVTGSATAVSTTSETVAGLVDPHGQATAY